MQWENMTAPEFADFAKDVDVCVIAMGVLEKHSDHLPLGTDYLNGHKIACMAAEKEPAMVFPPFYFGQIYEARCFPGTVTLKPTLLIELMENLFDEIARNGFKKIILYVAHGGNIQFCNFLAQLNLWEAKPYSLYVYWPHNLSEERKQQWQDLLETDVHGHACECETSISLANHGHLVKMDQVPKQSGLPLRRTAKTAATFTGVNWYSDYPDHYAGDASAASVEKGIALRQILVDSLAEVIKAVKEDTVVSGLMSEFFERVDYNK